MCEMLVMLAERTLPGNPDRERRAMTKAGMTVVIKDDGQPWGRMESKSQWDADRIAVIADNKPDPGEYPKAGFWGILKIPGVPESQWRHINHPQMVDDNGNRPAGRNPHFRIREWKINLNALGMPRLNQLMEEGELTLTEQEARPLIKRIRDGASLP